MAARVEALVLVRFLHGFTSIPVGPVAMALAADIVPPHRLGRYMGTLNMTVMLGLGVGPALGGIIRDGFVMVLGLNIFMGIGNGIAMPAGFVITGQLGMGSVMGVTNAGWSLGMIVSPILSGIIMDTLGLASIFLTGVSLFYQCVIVAFLSYLAWFVLVSRHPVSLLHAFSFFTPVFGVIISGVLILGEAIGPNLIAALMMVSAGMVLVNYRP
jgi:MFS family permease